MPKKTTTRNRLGNQAYDCEFGVVTVVTDIASTLKAIPAGRRGSFIFGIGDNK